MGITRRDETEGILVFEESLRPPPRCDPERNTNRLFGIKFLRPGGEELDQAGESEVDGKTKLIFLCSVLLVGSCQTSNNAQVKSQSFDKQTESVKV